MTRARATADTQDNNGGSVSPVVAGKNFLINGNFDFFQRGSLSTTSGGYGLDRWYQISTGSSGAVSVTQQTTGVPAGSRFCARITMGASSGYGNQYQAIETSNAVMMQGRTVTASIRLRRSAGFAGTLSFGLDKSSSVDNGVLGTWTAVAGVTATNANLPTGTGSSDWFTLSFTTTIPNDGTANTLRVRIEQSQVETSCYWEMSQAQLEIGSVATPFSRAGGTIQGELAACQRYFVAYNTNGVSGFQVAFGQQSSTTTSEHQIAIPVTMRATPSASFSAIGDWTVNNFINQIALTASSVISGRSGPEAVTIGNTWGSGIGTTGGLVGMLGNKTAARYYLSAEL